MTIIAEQIKQEKIKSKVSCKSISFLVELKIKLTKLQSTSVVNGNEIKNEPEQQKLMAKSTYVSKQYI